MGSDNDKNLPVDSHQQTQKKVKFVGTQDYINAATGEIVPMQVTEIEERDFNFSKVWMRNFIATLDLVGNQKTKLSLWLIDHLDKQNSIAMSYRMISNETGISLDTVRITMRILQDADFIRKVGTAYVVNPNVYFKGTRNARLAVLQDYHASERPKLSDEDKIHLLRDSISELQKQLTRLERKTNVVEDVEVDNQYTLTADADGNLEVVQQTKPKRKKHNSAPEPTISDIPDFTAELEEPDIEFEEPEPPEV